MQLKLLQTPKKGKYLQLTGTITGSFRRVWIRQEKSYNFSFMLPLNKFNWSVSVCMPNNLGYWQDRITWSFLFYQSLIMIWPTKYQFYNIAFVYEAFVIIDHNSKHQKQPNNVNDKLSYLWWYNTYLANKLWFAMLQKRVICILATQDRKSVV